MSTEFWISTVISLLAYAISLGAVYGSIKQRLKYLETKMDKHNCLVERMVVVEQSCKSAHNRIDEMR